MYFNFSRDRSICIIQCYNVSNLIVPRGSSDTVIAAKHDVLPPTISAKSTDKKGNNSKFSAMEQLSKSYLKATIISGYKF